MRYRYVIGLDISTHMGLSVIGDSGLEGIDRTIHTEQVEGTGRGMARALQMVTLLHDRLKVFGSPVEIGFAVVEQPAFRAKGGAAHNVQNELNAIIRFSLHMKGIPSFNVAPNTIKKFATGNGNAQKPEMIAAAREFRLGRDTMTDNEADALFMAVFGWELVDPGSTLGPNAGQLVKEWAGRNLKQLEQTGLFQ